MRYKLNTWYKHYMSLWDLNKDERKDRENYRQGQICMLPLPPIPFKAIQMAAIINSLQLHKWFVLVSSKNRVLLILNTHKLFSLTFGVKHYTLYMVNYITNIPYWRGSLGPWPRKYGAPDSEWLHPVGSTIWTFVQRSWTRRNRLLKQNAGIKLNIENKWRK